MEGGRRNLCLPAGEITKARAAELAGISICEIMDEVRRRGSAPSYSLDELREDLSSLVIP